MVPGTDGAKRNQRVSEPLTRNIDTLMQRRRQDSANENTTEKLAARVAAFTGSVRSVLLHSLVFGAWILINTGVTPIIAPWDPSLVVLAMIASVEAIFLTTFVLMNQRRQARVEEDRAELTLQVSLLAEHEMTKLASLVISIARELKVSIPLDTDVDELTTNVSPDTILDEIDRKRPEEKRNS
jgi:uncharacterized membrane protein